MTRFGGESWNVALPDGWQGHHDVGCESMFHANGPGALQITAQRKNGLVTADDLRDLAADHIANGAKPVDVQLGDFCGFTFSYGFESDYWRHWLLKAGSLALIVSYNCPLDERGAEDRVVQLILSSLRNSPRQ
jgi:hypothetical protein